MRQICVFASASDTDCAAYNQTAYELGRLIAESGAGLVFGAGGTGLMGQCARGVKDAGGRITGVIPDFFLSPGVCFEQIDQTIVTRTMHERKAKMEELADAFVALPGGFGTFEELLEVLTLRQLKRHAKPIVILNAGGYYTPLLAAFEHIFAEGLASEAFRACFRVAQNARQAMELTGAGDSAELPEKWLKNAAHGRE